MATNFHETPPLQLWQQLDYSTGSSFYPCTTTKLSSQVKSPPEVASSDVLFWILLQYKKDGSIKEEIFLKSSWSVNSWTDTLSLSQRLPRELPGTLHLHRHYYSPSMVGLSTSVMILNSSYSTLARSSFSCSKTASCEVCILPILKILREAHPGMARLKAMACSHVWLSGIDSDIENTVRGSQECLKTREEFPSLALLPTTPWWHLQSNTWQSNHYLLIVNIHSKWPEFIGPMKIKITTAEANCNALHSFFARYSLPAQIVSDNRPPFQSLEYKEICSKTAFIEYWYPLHPSPDGLAERFVQTFSYASESSLIFNL